MTKELVFVIEMRVRVKDLDGLEMSRVLDACRECGSAEVVDTRLDEVSE